jgi:hypothetical protein
MATAKRVSARHVSSTFKLLRIIAALERRVAKLEGALHGS